MEGEEVEVDGEISGALSSLGEVGASGGAALERAIVSWAAFSSENSRGRVAMVRWKRDDG